MLADIGTIVWKELKEFFMPRGSSRSMLISLLFMVLVFSVFMPMQFGREWIESPVSLAAWAWLPLFLVTSMIADSFAGERERHTLETLLASPLSDRAILFGKMAAAISYAMGMTVLLLGVALITINVANWDGTLLLYPMTTILGAFVLGTLGAGLVASLGVLLSLRAATVRQAVQSLSIGIVMLIWIPVIAQQVLPNDLKIRLLAKLTAMNTHAVMAAIVVILLVANAIFLSLAMARFQRARLILE